MNKPSFAVFVLVLFWSWNFLEKKDTKTFGNATNRSKFEIGYVKVCDKRKNRIFAKKKRRLLKN